MPVPISHLLMLWSILLAPGAGIDHGPAVAPNSIVRLVASASCPDRLAIVEASNPGAEWPWELSEADTAEEESEDGDDLGLANARSASARPTLASGRLPAIRREGEAIPRRFRSSILRC